MITETQLREMVRNLCKRYQKRSALASTKGDEIGQTKDSNIFKDPYLKADLTKNQATISLIIPRIEEKYVITKKILAGTFGHHIFFRPAVLYSNIAEYFIEESVKSETVTRGYTSQGSYLVTKLISTSPDKEIKKIREYKFS